jgi:hypothetical protein
VMTTDDPIDRDGKGDEIYGAAFIRKYDRKTLSILEYSNKRTRTYGDGNGRPERVPGGTQNPSGGVAPGNVLPNGGTPHRQLPAQESVMPMKLWEGTLTDNTDALVISPSVWEDDNDPSHFTSWVQNQQTTNDWLFTTQKVQTHLASRAFTPIVLEGVDAYSQYGESAGTVALRGAAALFGIPLSYEQVVMTFRDRPIGLTAPAQTGGGPSNITTTLPNTVVVLTRESIEAALGARPHPVLASEPPVIVISPTPGVMAITFKDRASPSFNTERRACYIMTIHVERL